MVVAWVSKAMDLIYPASPVCAFCGRRPERGDVVCPLCRRDIGSIVSPMCRQCGKPWDLDELCPDCRQWQHAFLMVRAVGVYEGYWRQTIHGLKFQKQRSFARGMGRLMAESFWRYALPKPDMLLAVPITAERMRERGFNQTELVTLEMARHVHRPVATQTIVRIGDGLPQASLGREARRHNVEKAFQMTDPERVRGRSILVIDDIYTTGHTMSACCRAVLQSGAREVRGLVLAIVRQPGDFH